MPYIKNPNYNPNDPKSQRYILQSDPFTSFLSTPKNQTPAPNMSVAPKTTTPQVSTPKINYADPYATSFSSKTSTPSNIPTPTPKPTTPNTPNQTPAPNMSVAPKTPSSYTVKSGDTLGAIASRNGTTVAELMRLNPSITNPNLIYPGQQFKLPGAIAPTTAPTTPAPASVPPAPTPTPTQPQQPGANMPAPTPTAPSTPAQAPSTGDATTDAALKSLAEQAGKAGMSLEDYLGVVNKSSAPTKAESDAIRNKLGIPDLIDDAFAKPQQNTVQLYKELYDLSGLNDIKAKVKELDDQIAQKRADLVTATGELYNNPWISQATRSGRLGNLQRIALADIENTIAQKDQYLSLYDDGISEIESSIQRSVFDTGLERDLTVEKLNYLLTEAERDEQFAQRAVEQRALRYLPDFLSNQPREGAEGFTLSEGQARYDAQGNLIASRDKAQEFESQWKKVTYNGVDYEQNQVTGEIRTPQIPLDTEATRSRIEAINTKLDLIDQIQNAGALDAIVGPNTLVRWDLPFRGGARNEAVGAINQLVDQETLATLMQLKAQGGTLGAISEKELGILQSAATQIKSWEDPENPGRYIISEKRFNEELEKIRASAQRLKAGILQITPEQLNKVEEARREYGLTEQEVIQQLRFNQESQTSTNGNLSPLAASIVQQESGGNYQAVGQVPAGYSEADRALGKYQIVPKYHFDKIGLPNTPAGRQQFINSPALQDQLFNIIISDLEKRYNGDPRKVAAAYYGGAGGAAVVGTPAGDKPQYAGGKAYPSINQYVNSVLSRLS